MDLSDPLVMAGAGGLVGLLIVVFVVRRGRGGSFGDEVADAAAKLAKKGDFVGAGKRALSDEKYGASIEYFLKAQQPGNAAYAAARMGDSKRAAELYERAGEKEQAARYYRRAGLDDKADRLVPNPETRSGAATIAAASGRNTGNTPTAAETALAKFRTEAAKSVGTDAAKGELQVLARDAADALLASGDLRAAAEIYREADLLDEAVHLYVNVLGSPGEAAPLVAARGHHERAAELYEMAGKKERAALAWTEVAKRSPRPDSYVERIERNNPVVAVNFLKRQTEARPIDRNSIALHYSLADILERQGEIEQSKTMFEQIVSAVGDYRDAAVRLQTLAQGSPTGSPKGSPKPANSGQDIGKGQGKGEEDIGNADTQYGHGSLLEPAEPIAGPSEWMNAPISRAQLAHLASQVAEAAAAQLRRRGGDILTMLGAAPVRASAARPHTAVVAAGLETSPIAVELLFDSAVLAARHGPTIEALRAYVGDSPCELQNIEVFYRLGLAFVAKGAWDDAQQAFEAVEEASPGYRDADKRAQAIRAWGQALGAKRTQLGGTPDRVDGGGRYVLSGELGRGGMAVVYRARDSLLGRDVALKFLSEEFSSMEDMRVLFEREARSAAALNHRNIVTIHDFGLLEGRAFICMEYLEGATIEDLIEEQGLTIVESLQIAKQTAAALGYAHGQKIIHRDIKPANMMRTPEGLVKVTDFGLAKSLDTNRQSSVIAGTPGFMSPEQLAGTDVDHRTDIFALGVSLYSMLSGKMPFKGLQRETPKRIREHVPAIPEVLDDAIARALELQPAKRFQRVEDFAEPIEVILKAVSSFAEDGGPLRAAPEEAKKNQDGDGATVSFRKPDR